MHNTAQAFKTTVRQGLLCEHFIAQVAYNQHEQINGTQLFKSMSTIRLFENKIDLLEALTVVQQPYSFPRKDNNNKNIGEAVLANQGKLSIHLRLRTDTRIPHTTEAVNQ